MLSGGNSLILKPMPTTLRKGEPSERKTREMPVIESKGKEHRAEHVNARVK